MKFIIFFTTFMITISLSVNSANEDDSYDHHFIHGCINRQAKKVRIGMGFSSGVSIPILPIPIPIEI